VVKIVPILQEVVNRMLDEKESDVAPPLEKKKEKEEDADMRCLLGYLN
jgi:hypothetical protein